MSRLQPFPQILEWADFLITGKHSSLLIDEGKVFYIVDVGSKQLKTLFFCSSRDKDTSFDQKLFFKRCDRFKDAFTRTI